MARWAVVRCACAKLRLKPRRPASGSPDARAHWRPLWWSADNSARPGRHLWAGTGVSARGATWRPGAGTIGRKVAMAQGGQCGPLSACNLAAILIWCASALLALLCRPPAPHWSDNNRQRARSRAKASNAHNKAPARARFSSSKRSKAQSQRGTELPLLLVRLRRSCRDGQQTAVAGKARSLFAIGWRQWRQRQLQKEPRQRQPQSGFGCYSSPATPTVDGLCAAAVIQAPIELALKSRPDCSFAAL